MPDIQIWTFFLLFLAVLWAGILVGSWIRVTRPEVVESESKTINVLEGALLTLFGLLIGFTFSMAVSSPITAYDKTFGVLEKATAI